MFLQAGIEKTQASPSHLHTYVARTIRALKSDERPERSKIETLFKQAKEQIALANAYAIYARKEKIEMDKQLSNFTAHVNAINALMSQPQIRALILQLWRKKQSKCLKKSSKITSR